MWTSSSVRILIPTKARYQRDRLVEVAEAADEDLDDAQQRAQSEQRERVRGPDHDRVARDRECGRDRVDGERDVGHDDRDHHEQQRRAVQAAALAHEQAAAAEPTRGRDRAADEAQHEVPVRVGRLGGAAEGAVRDVQQQHAEPVDDDLEAIEQRHPDRDRDRAQHQRAGDADRDHTAAQLRRDREVPEQQREQEDVVERERALDQVHGGPLACRPARDGDAAGDDERERQPPDAPDDRLPPARCAAAGEQPQLRDDSCGDGDHGGRSEGELLDQCGSPPVKASGPRPRESRCSCAERGSRGVRSHPPVDSAPRR